MHLLAAAESIQLFPDGTIFVHIGLILGMIWLLNRTFYRPINRVLAAREKNKGGRSSEAIEILENVREKEARYNSEMLDARSQGYELIEKEQKQAAAAREQKIGVVKAEVAEKIVAGKSELQTQTAEARAAIGADAEKLADEITASILKG